MITVALPSYRNSELVEQSVFAIGHAQEQEQYGLSQSVRIAHTYEYAHLADVPLTTDQEIVQVFAAELLPAFLVAVHEELSLIVLVLPCEFCHKCISAYVPLW